MELPARIGKYELEEFLGGGMSHVYRARDTVIGRTVAIKILTEAGCQDAEAKARFLAEARMAGNISHENIISIYDFGEDEKQRPYMVMEFLQGEDLRHAIKNGHTGDLRNRIRLALGVARALEYVHLQKIVHRDIKPENVQVTTGGIVKLMDFGIAKSEGLAMTRAGYVLGTPYYMAPEQVNGQNVTDQVDVYAFGVLVFELLTGNKPIAAETVERIFYSILNEPLNVRPLHDAGLPESVCDLVSKCTQKGPAARPQGFAPICASLKRVVTELEAATELPATQESTIPLPTTRLLVQPAGVRPRRKTTWLLLPWALVGVALIALLAWLLPVGRVRDGAARPIFKVDAEPTSEALAAHLHGSVELEAVIDKSGRVLDVRVVRALGMGLDESAVQAFKRWRFRPAYRDGAPIPSAIAMTFEFSLN
jgi:TonB family protein